MSHFENNEDSLNGLLNALKKNPENFPSELPDAEEIVVDKSTEINLDDEYKKLLLRLAKSIDNNSLILEDAAQLVRMVGDDKTLEAYASVAKSNADLLKTLSSAISERDRIRTQERLKEKDLEVKKEIAAGKIDNSKLGSGTTNIQNNYILKSSRDEMFDMMFGNKKDKEKAQEKILGEIVEVQSTTPAS